MENFKGRGGFKQMRIFKWAIFPVLFFTLGCFEKLVGVNVTIVDQKTALENQVLGSFQEIDNDMMLLASVRSVDETGKLKAVEPVVQSKRTAIFARQRMDFNKDDVESFKAEGCAGENNVGLLDFFETKKTKNDPSYKQFVQAIIGEENEDRLTILKRVLATNEAFGEGDLEKVRRIYAGLSRDNAKKGEMIQTPEGEWVRKK
jgi:hypothetical protein